MPTATATRKDYAWTSKPCGDVTETTTFLDRLDPWAEGLAKLTHGASGFVVFYPVKEIPMEPHVEAGLRHLGALIAKRTGTNPTENTGPDVAFTHHVFRIAGYCWCDGERHPEGCPPNFRYGAFTCRWYKYLGRSGVQSRPISPDEWRTMLATCLEIIERQPV